MARTDLPLKRLVEDFAPDFAAWLLDVDIADVYDVRSVKIELPADAMRSDTVFHVALASGQRTWLHVEFQGRSSERPMPLRMLDYISRLVQREWAVGETLSLCSAVLYVGAGAGARDTGRYEVTCPGGDVTLAWRYRVIRLWQMAAEDLLALERPALLTLIGQTRIAEPERVLPEVMQTLYRVEDVGQRARLLAALTSLMQDEEILAMAEKMVDAMDRGLLLDTPFLRRIRAEGHEEGREEGLEEGLERGIEKGIEKGMEKGREEAIRQSVLDVITVRFDPPASTYRLLEANLAQVQDPAHLRQLLQVAAQATNLADFEQALD